MSEKNSDAWIVDTACCGDIRMPYCRFGSGKQVFVILPGLSIKPVTLSAQAVAAGFAAFTARYTVYLFDRRTNLPERYSIDDMADDTVAVMKALGIQQADFFGASQGGMMVQSIAVRHPEMTHHIVLGSTASRLNGTLEAVVDRWIGLALKKDGYGLNQAVSETIYAPTVYQQFKDVLLAAGKAVTEEDLARFVILASSIRGLNLYDQLDRIQCRTLVIGCEGDQVTTPEGAAEIAQKLHCPYISYGPEFGHAVFDEAPDYRTKVLDFLSRP